MKIDKDTAAVVMRLLTDTVITQSEAIEEMEENIQGLLKRNSELTSMVDEGRVSAVAKAEVKPTKPKKPGSNWKSTVSPEQENS